MASARDEEVLRALAAAGAEWTPRANEKRTALCIAALRGELHVVEALAPLFTHEERTGAIVKAIRRERTDALGALAAAGADADVRGAGMHTALTLAASGGKLAVVEALLPHVRVDAPGRSDMSALLWANWLGHDAVVAALLAAGADVPARAPDGNNALHMASEGGFAVVAERLVGAGVELEGLDEDGRTPLHIACVNAHCAVAVALARRGARLTDTMKEEWGGEKGWVWDSDSDDSDSIPAEVLAAAVS